jgi:2-keto-4-pentenoate hydratase/2-oxohepta-3-ene-1,7-dioic acid hydratase in catechol pathway
MKIICIGRNYVNHIAELQNERPAEPVVFMKPDTAVLQKSYPFIIPEFSEDVHYEIELIVKINKVGKYIDAKFAHKYYDEISVGIDFTARDVQDALKSKGLPWEKAKAFDGSAVLGEFVSKTDFDSVDDVRIELRKNGDTVQNSSTSYMIWKVNELIAEVSKYITLRTGDVLFTGTPEGVGAVTEGDVLEGYLEGKQLFKVNVK